MTCRAVLAICVGVLASQNVTRRQVRRFQERPEPADAEDSSDGLPEKEKKQDSDIEEDSMHVPALRLPTRSLDERPLTDLGSPIVSIQQAKEGADQGGGTSRRAAGFDQVVTRSCVR